MADPSSKTSALADAFCGGGEDGTTEVRRCMEDISGTLDIGMLIPVRQLWSCHTIRGVSTGRPRGPCCAAWSVTLHCLLPVVFEMALPSVWAAIHHA